MGTFCPVRIFALAVGTWFVWSKLSDTGPTFKGQLITHTVKRENLQLVVTERGTLEAAQNRDVICQVKASKGSTIATTIRWVIDDGTHVEQGDELVRLDDSGLQEQLKTQMIVRDKAKNDWRQAEATQKSPLAKTNRIWRPPRSLWNWRIWTSKSFTKVILPSRPRMLADGSLWPNPIWNSGKIAMFGWIAW